MMIQMEKETESQRFPLARTPAYAYIHGIFPTYPEFPVSMHLVRWCLRFVSVRALKSGSYSSSDVNPWHYKIESKYASTTLNTYEIHLCKKNAPSWKSRKYRSQSEVSTFGSKNALKTNMTSQSTLFFIFTLHQDLCEPVHVFSAE